MPVFEYMAKAAPNQVVRGRMQAESESALIHKLSEKGLYPLDISPVNGGMRRNMPGVTLFQRKKIAGYRLLMTRQLANMLAAGMSLYDAINYLRHQLPPGPFQDVVRDIQEKLKEGYRFSEACQAWPKVFSPFYVNMIRAGEAGGMLDLILDQLADFLENEDEVRKQVQTALIYPAVMLSMGLITVTVLLTVVIPKIVSMFEEMHQTLPFPTRVLIQVSNLATRDWPLLLLGAAGMYGLLRIARRRPSFQWWLDRVKLRLPFFKDLLIQAETTQFARTLSALLAHGVPVQQALKVVMASCKNRIIRREFARVAESVRQGGRLGAGLRGSPVLPPLFGEMIAIAERTNQLEETLKKIADAGAREIERRVNIFTRMLEPTMILLLGLVIGFIVFAIMLPIFQIDFVVQ